MATRTLWLVGLGLLGLLAGMAVLFNSSNADEASTGNSPYFSPAGLPNAKAMVSATQACVEPLEVIRRQHGQLMQHQRDDTVHQGIRGSQHSLKGCINCHVTPNAQGQTLSIHDDPQHFCSVCHQFAAVKIDCFQCHASTPE